MSKLLFKYGTMNSGKTIDLIRTAYNYEENNGKVLVLKPMIDTKGNNNIVSRIGLERKVDYLIKNDDNLYDILKGKLNNIDAILVDEAEFFTSKQIEDLSVIGKALDIDIICYGLRINFKGELFEGSKKLMEVADSLEELVTLCKCRKVARFVGRKVNGKYVSDGEEVIIDGSNENIKYEPLCKDCYLKKVKKLSYNNIRNRLK